MRMNGSYLRITATSTPPLLRVQQVLVPHYHNATGKLHLLNLQSELYMQAWIHLLACGSPKESMMTIFFCQTGLLHLKVPRTACQPALLQPLLEPRWELPNSSNPSNSGTRLLYGRDMTLQRCPPDAEPPHTGMHLREPMS